MNQSTAATFLRWQETMNLLAVKERRLVVPMIATWIARCILWQMILFEGQGV